MKLEILHDDVVYGPICTSDKLLNEFNITSLPDCPYCGSDSTLMISSHYDYEKNLIVEMKCGAKDCDCKWNAIVLNSSKYFLTFDDFVI